MSDPPRPRFAVYVERCTVEGALLTVSGWAFGRRAPLAGARMVFATARSHDAVDVTIRLPRPDVGERFGPHALLSGFAAFGMLVLEPGRLWLELSDEGGASDRVLLGGWAADPSTGTPVWRVGEAAIGGGGLNAILTFGALPPGRYLARRLGGFARPAPALPSLRPVSILASLYKGERYLDAFFLSLRERTDGYAEIVLCDNGNDDAALSARIVAEAARVPRCRVVRRALNEGYIAGIGQAFAARRERGHVVVLNTDVELPPGWLPRLLWPLDNLPGTASATPFTNAGTSCSFPLPEIDNDLFLGLDTSAIDSAFQQLDPATACVELPSGVGFCMAMHADAIAAVGWFDAAAFGYGYGEENDWCMRARALGWRDLLVPNLFVYHKHGGTYPAATKLAQLRLNLSTVAQRHPTFFNAVRDYFAADPAAVYRTVTAFRLACMASARVPQLFMLGPGDDPRAAFAALARGEAVLLVLFDAARRGWSALLAASRWRGQLWGWGLAEVEALEALVYTAVLPPVVA